MNKHEIAGGNLLVMHHGEEIYHAQAGMADIVQERHRKRQPIQIVFHVKAGNVSSSHKLLMERELLICFDPISKYIPLFAESMVATEHRDEKAVRQVTVKDCPSINQDFQYTIVIPIPKAKIQQLYMRNWIRDFILIIPCLTPGIC